jgi:hypothetical protein
MFLYKESKVHYLIMNLNYAIYEIYKSNNETLVN